MVIVEARDRKLSPHIEIISKEGKILAGGTILPVKATLVVTNNQSVQRGQTLVKIPKDIGNQEISQEDCLELRNYLRQENQLFQL